MEDEEEERIIGESGWNLSESDIFLIASLRKEALNYYTQGKLEQSFFKWKAIKFVISGRFTSEERTELTALEKELFEKSIKKGLGEEKPTINRSAFAMHLETYIDKLNQLMRRYKLDIADRVKKIKLS